MKIKVFYGREIENIISDLARLRIKVFHDYPYLYEGDFDYEKNYLKIYPQSKASSIVAVYDGEQMVGAASCLPLKDEAEYVKRPFEEASIDINTIYYFGESVLLKEYRGRGIGNIFFEKREEAATKFHYNVTAFCAVVRENEHPLRPKNYKPLDEFWIKRGYQKNENLISEFSWLDIGETIETKKKMVYWMKNNL
jgi:GNAT superfamily N-acetyltransferase